MPTIIPEELFSKSPVPNKFTRVVGVLIRVARENAEMSQSELGELVELRQATISDIENGKSDFSFSTLIRIAFALDKPVSYFVPGWIRRQLSSEDLNPYEEELIIHYRNIEDEKLRRLAVSQMISIASFDHEDTATPDKE